MRLLGIDYGTRKVGLAFSDAPLAEPVKVIRFKSEFDLFDKLEEAVKEYSAQKIVVGVAEGDMAVKQREFASKLAKRVGVPIVLQDETLSTKETNTKLSEIKKSWRKRKALEDACAATVILQRYIDS